MFIEESYDIPQEIAQGHHSFAFDKFLRNWFANTDALYRCELDRSFLKDLTPEEHSLAKDLIRRNLKTGHQHLIETVSILHDTEAASCLCAMLEVEKDESRCLIIALQLWKLGNDPVFVKCLEHAMVDAKDLFCYPNLLRILWLNDERAVLFLIDLLDLPDRSNRNSVLSLLNQLESGAYIPAASWELPSQPADFQRRRQDQSFLSKMAAAVRKFNIDNKDRWW